MTFRRLINRNQLADGDYHKAPAGWASLTDAGGHAHLDEAFCGFEDAAALATAYRGLWDDWVAGRKTLAGRLALFAGDLRRLEKDTVDEAAICATIAIKTGLDKEVVAAVVKEWLAT